MFEILKTFIEVEYIVSENIIFSYLIKFDVIPYHSVIRTAAMKTMMIKIM